MINWFKRLDWFKKGRKPKVEEPDYSGLESPMKYMIVPTSSTRWDVYRINKKDAEAWEKKGRPCPLSEWDHQIYSYSETGAQAYIEERLQEDLRDVWRKHRDIAFRRDNPPYVHPPE